MNIAWHSEDKPFTVGYADGKVLVGSKKPLENGAIVVIDAHQVSSQTHPNPVVLAAALTWDRSTRSPSPV